MPPAPGNHSRSDPSLELDPGVDPFSAGAIERLVERFGSPLFIIDTERVRTQYRALVAALPGVDLHYALKPLPHSSVVSTLAQEGAFFDLATNGEVELVRRLGIDAQRCIHTHPIKRDRDIRTALDYGVTRFVVDNPDELRKFEKFRSRVRLLVRLSFRSPEAVVDLSRKFGCDPEDAAALFSQAADARIPIEGLSFHVGSQAAGPSMMVRAIGVCRELLASAKQAGHDLSILDIGGGFPVEYLKPIPPIGEFCAPVRAALAQLPEGIRVIAEPGRFIAGPAAIAVASVMGRALRDGHWWYYLDDGVYGSYSGQLYDHAIYPVQALAAGGPHFSSVLAGPTCDSVDVIREGMQLPKLDVGDLIVGRVMGAYTLASASDFNFFPRATVLALDHGRLLSNEADL